MENTVRSRRMFVKSVAATSIVVAFVGLDGLGNVAAAAPSRRDGQAFALDHDESVRVKFTTGRRFELTVIDADGKVLERRRNLSTRRLLMIRSDHFTARAIQPPVAG